MVDGGGEDLRGGERIGAAELAGGNQATASSAPMASSSRSMPSAGAGPMVTSDDLAAGGVLEPQGGLHSVQVVGVGDGGHGGTDP